MYRFLATPRWIAGFLVLLVAIAIMIRLGFWQYERAELKRSTNDTIQAARAADPQPAAQLIPPTPQQLPEVADEWSQVTVTGTYDPEGTILIRQRSFTEGVGFEIVVPLTTADGTTYLIDRGYIIAEAGAAQAPDLPPTPTGDVTVTGVVKRPYAAAENATRVEQIGDLRSVRAIDPVLLSESLGVSVAGGYIIAYDEVTADGTVVSGIARIPGPELDDGPHLSYAVQWWLFGAMSLVGFGFLARREAITRLLADDDLDHELEELERLQRLDDLEREQRAATAEVRGASSADGHLTTS